MNCGVDAIPVRNYDKMWPRGWILVPGEDNLFVSIL